MSMFETKTTQGHCETHGDYESSAVRIGDKWREQGCPECSKLREAEEDAKRQRQQTENKRRHIERLYSRSGIPPRYTKRTVENFRAESPEQEKAKESVRRYLLARDEMFKRGAGVIMAGNPGTGKTHLACAIGNAVMQSGKTVLFITVPAMLRKIRSSYRSDAKTTEQGEIDSLRDIDLLIIDEIGVQRGTESEEHLIFEVINERYSCFKPTVLISNLNTDGIKKYLGERTIDRMREGGGKFIPFTWGSYRKNVADDDCLPDAENSIHAKIKTK